MSNVTPLFGRTVTGMTRDEIVKEMAMHLVAGRVDLCGEDDAFLYLYSTENQYGHKVISEHIDDAIALASQIHLSREIERVG